MLGNKDGEWKVLETIQQCVEPQSYRWNPGWLSTSVWGPVVVPLMNEGCQESTENSDTSKAVAEILTAIKVGKKK